MFVVGVKLQVQVLGDFRGGFFQLVWGNQEGFLEEVVLYSFERRVGVSRLVGVVFQIEEQFLLECKDVRVVFFGQSVWGVEGQEEGQGLDCVRDCVFLF